MGDGPENKRLAALAESLGVAGKVKFWGLLPREEALRRLAQSHVLRVHPSLHESGGGVCLEAMAARCRVICLNLGGPAVLAGDGAGIVIDATDVATTEARLAEAMLRLSGDRELCRRMGETGQRNVTQRYLWRHKAQRYGALYAQVLKTR